MIYWGPSLGLWWIFPVVFFCFWICLFFFVFPRAAWHHRHYYPPGSSAEAILKERFARGEIDENEYREKLRVLRDHQ